MDPGGVAAPPPVVREPAENSKSKRLKGKTRVKNVIKVSKWDWHGSSLDPGFRRPRISLKRKKEENRSSESSVASISHEASDREDLSRKRLRPNISLGNAPASRQSCNQGREGAVVDINRRERRAPDVKSNLCHVLPADLCAFGSLDSHEERIFDPRSLSRLFVRGQCLEISGYRSPTHESRRTDQSGNSSQYGQSARIDSGRASASSISRGEPFSCPGATTRGQNPVLLGSSLDV